MVTAKPFSVTNLQPQVNGSYRFTVIVHTSLGQFVSLGWLYDAQHRVLAPSIRYGPTTFFQTVKITRNMRSLLRKLVDKAVLQYAKHEAHKAAQDSQVS
jgi:hypothetical protein